jgi:hypothetical protein
MGPSGWAEGLRLPSTGAPPPEATPPPRSTTQYPVRLRWDGPSRRTASLNTALEDAVAPFNADIEDAVVDAITGPALRNIAPIRRVIVIMARLIARLTVMSVSPLVAQTSARSKSPEAGTTCTRARAH